MDTTRITELTELDIETPAFVYDELVMEDNITAARKALQPIEGRLLLAMKSFSFLPGLRHLVPLLDGLHASSVFEARLARQVLDGGTIHTTSPGLRERDLDEIARLSDKLSFNSLSQLGRYLPAVEGVVSPGLRVNPGLSFVADERCDPAARNSKLGVPISELEIALSRSPGILEGVEGLLVHTNSESTHFAELAQVIDLLLDRIGPLLAQLSWINLGGGYLFAEAEDQALLQQAVGRLKHSYDLEVFFEPGFSLVNSAGVLVSTVVDVFHSGARDVAVLDTSVAHAPEVFEFNWSPTTSCEDGCNHYVLAGASCLSGDLFGEHCLDAPLAVGDRLVLSEVGAYSLVKASWFNGLALPNVYSRKASGELVLERRFEFEDFLNLNRENHVHK